MLLEPMPEIPFPRAIEADSWVDALGRVAGDGEVEELAPTGREMALWRDEPWEDLTSTD